MHSGSVITGLSIRRCGHGSDECLACQAPQICKSLSFPLTLPLTSDLWLRARKPREGRALSTVSFIHGKRQALLALSNLDESWSCLTHCCTQVGFFDSTNRKMLIWFSNEIKALSLIHQDSHYVRACNVTCVLLLSLAGCVALGRMHATLGLNSQLFRPFQLWDHQKAKGERYRSGSFFTHIINEICLLSESSNRVKNHPPTFCLHSPQSHFSLKWLLFTVSCGSFSPFGKHLCCIHGYEQTHFKNSVHELHYDRHFTNLPFSLYQRYLHISVYILFFFSQLHHILYYGCVCFTSLLLMDISLFS